MCGRYYFGPDDPELGAILAQVRGDFGDAVISYGEIFPSNTVPVMGPDGRFAPMTWGFSRFDGKGVLINARSETAFSLTTFRTPMRDCRCLVPASHYFEWDHCKPKGKYAMATPDGEPLWLAGCFRMEKDERFARFVILTRAAVDSLSVIHDRMPVIINPGNREQWFWDPEVAILGAMTDIQARRA